jgi:hypothetical protein
MMDVVSMPEPRPLIAVAALLDAPNVLPSTVVVELVRALAVLESTVISRLLCSVGHRWVVGQDGPRPLRRGPSPTLLDEPLTERA